MKSSTRPCGPSRVKRGLAAGAGPFYLPASRGLAGVSGAFWRPHAGCARNKNLPVRATSLILQRAGRPYRLKGRAALGRSGLFIPAPWRPCLRHAPLPPVLRGGLKHGSRDEGVRERPATWCPSGQRSTSERRAPTAPSGKRRKTRSSVDPRAEMLRTGAFCRNTSTSTDARCGAS